MSQRIKKIEVKGKKISLELTRSQQPKGLQSVVKKTRRETTDQIPHVDLLRALERMTPHLLIACDFAKPTDDNDIFLQDSHFADRWWMDDERYEGVELTGVHVATKADETAIYLIGKKENERGGITFIKTPIISFIKTESAQDYPLIDIIKRQFETLWHEVEEFTKGKTGDEQLQMSLNAVAPEKEAAEV